jgi:hypothetical protein
MTRRRLLGVLAAVLLALVIARGLTVVVPSQCQFLDPADNWFRWWWYGCDKGDPAPGGGGSGAG